MNSGGLNALLINIPEIGIRPGKESTLSCQPGQQENT